ncbi:MAG TPA: cytidine deaminase [Amaricoccus sp.]|jgi:cytidine deaminase|nr:cytidine deaminase [Amaricoccus sp.]
MDLFEIALRARANAHAPYSGFRVGAALRCPDGSVHAGCNVENVAYPEGTCAEAGAIAAMVAAGRREIAEVLVVADSPTPVTPCGGCRQKLAEFARPEVPVILAGLAGELARTTVGGLLPGAFGERHMRRAEP